MQEAAWRRLSMALAASALAIVLTSGSMPLTGWAEELPTPVVVDPEPVFEPPVVEPPVLEEEPADIPSPPPTESNELAPLANPAQQTPVVVPPSQRPSSGGSTRRPTPDNAPEALPETVPQPTPATPLPSTAPPTPQKSATPTPTLDPSIAGWNVDYGAPTSSGGAPTLAFLALVSSLLLIVLLAGATLFYKLRLANRLPRGPFQRS
jgi:hypothetical protein